MEVEFEQGWSEDYVLGGTKVISFDQLDPRCGVRLSLSRLLSVFVVKAYVLKLNALM